MNHSSLFFLIGNLKKTGFGLIFFLFFVFSIFAQQSPRISLGIDYLTQINFSVLEGKRVGLLTHPAGKNKAGLSSVEVMRNSKTCNLVALFGPEHGIYGDEKAAVPVDDKIDAKTGLPVFSLYGKYRKPTPKMLSEIDCLVIDMQDVGVRCYTYISCMRYAMEACFESGAEVVVLDRPNPLGGIKIAGPMIDEKWMSYVGAFPMPFVHGLTIGEIALWSKKTPGILKISEAARRRGKLTIVPMKGWKREMTWPATGLKWYPTSPNIPSLDSVAGYPMTGLGAQMGKFKHGIGTKHPFRFLTFKGVPAQKLKDTLESKNLAGLSFRLKKLQDSQGKEIVGVYIIVSNWSEWKPTQLAFAMMELSAKWENPSPFTQAKDSEITLFNKHVGSTAWWEHLANSGQTVTPAPFMERWERECKNFQTEISRFFLYK